jgi:transposase InsO family protein
MASCIGHYMQSKMAGGIPTNKLYKYATIFVDHYRRLGFIYLQQQLTSEETVNAKKAFKTYAATYGVKILHYHADNGRFADKAFRQAISEKGQTISFCGINAHWQNGVAERRIRELQENANTMLLYAQRRWPDAINKHLWPYMLRMANNIHNNVPIKDEKDSPLEKFSGTKIAPHLRHFHHFGCPTYVLDGKIQQGQKIRKWQERSRVGIYLGHSPQHSCSIALVLSLRTGHVSPQYHYQFDDLFETHTKITMAN